MSFKKIISSLGLVVFLVVSLQAFVVFDPANFAQLVDNFETVTKNWDSLIGGEGIVSQFVAKLKKLEMVGQMATQAMGGEEFESIEMVDIQKYIEGAFFKDVKGIEIWKAFFSGQEKLAQVFQGLDYYNESFREEKADDPGYISFVEENIKQEREYIQNLQNLTDFIAAMRKWEQERVDKFKQYSDLIKKYAQGTGGIGHTSSLEAVGNAIRLEILKAEEQLLAVSRVMLESELKEKVMKLDKEKRHQQMIDLVDQKNREKNAVEGESEQ